MRMNRHGQFRASAHESVVASLLLKFHYAVPSALRIVLTRLFLLPQAPKRVRPPSRCSGGTNASWTSSGGRWSGHARVGGAVAAAATEAAALSSAAPAAVAGAGLCWPRCHRLQQAEGLCRLRRRCRL